MNNKVIKRIIIILIIVLGSLLIGTTSKAALECKPGGNVYTNITVNDSYLLCYDMRNGDSTLGNHTLDPHLTTNADWGAAAYLGLSAYGNVRNKNGTTVTINGKSYYSTTNNITGVMDMGKNYTQTASLIKEYSETGYIGSLKANLNTKYVETLAKLADDNTINLGRAFKETSGWFDSENSYFRADMPVGIRIGVLGFSISAYGDGSRCCFSKYNI